MRENEISLRKWSGGTAHVTAQLRTLEGGNIGHGWVRLRNNATCALTHLR